MDGFDLVRSLKLLPGIILGLTVHEFSHAFIAHLCGDTTSRDQGRVTLNPLKHIDPLGFIMLFIAGFGWAKPVQFNEQNLRNPKTDVLKIAVAGPISNAVTAMLLSVVLIILNPLKSFNPTHGMYVLDEVLKYAININWVLFIFNLIPLPPLDGSHLLLSQFRKFPRLYAGLYKYGSYILFILILGYVFTGINLLPIGPLINFFYKGFFSLFGFHV